jgi:hypothetical protein
MGKERDNMDKGLGKQPAKQPGIEDIPGTLDNRFWIREDGALCWGDGCLVIKPEGKDLRIKVDGSKCGGLALEAYGKAIEDTIGKGGQTIYEVPARIEHTDK